MREDRKLKREERERVRECRKNPRPECFLLDQIIVTGSRIVSTDIITNNQDAGIDEGDIVKKVGPLLMVLRQGQLHVLDTGETGAERLQLLHSHKVVDGEADEDLWYDEILAFQGGAILLGFNHVINTAELFVFSLDSKGGLHSRGRWRLEVDDYFAGNDYGARVRDEELVLSLSFNASTLLEGEWPGAAQLDDEGEPIAGSETDLLRPEDVHVLDGLHEGPRAYVFLRCDLAELLQQKLECKRSTAVANSNASSYVAADGIYLADFAWTRAAYRQPDFSPWYWSEDAMATDHYRSRVLRLPLDTSQAPGLVDVAGFVGDRFNFKEGSDGLYVLSWEHPDASTWSELLQHIPFEAFVGGAPQRAEVRARIDGRATLVRLDEEAVWLGLRLPGEGDDDRAVRLLRQPLEGGPAVSQALPFPAWSIELLRDHVLLLGHSNEELWKADDLLSVLADKRSGRLGPNRRYPDVRANPSDRSHAFNSARLGAGADVAGLPVAAKHPKGFENHRDEDELPQDLLILRREGDALELAARVDMQHVAAACELDCWGWYGSARFFAFGDRLFALSGELFKELRFEGEQLREVASVRLRANPAAAPLISDK